jgi:polysaccharide export outer membrane protein
MGKDRFGADEFVIDSYKIREGKFSILEMQGKVYEDFDDALLVEYEDQVREGDVLSIALYHAKRADLVSAVSLISQTVGFRVANRCVALPGLLSPVSIAGLPLEAARQCIEQSYNAENNDVKLFLAYRERVTCTVELAGLASAPSVVADGKIRLFDVLSKAHVPADANLFKSYIVRGPSFLPVDFYKLLKEGDMSQNIVMHGGDKIYIAEPGAAIVMVMGEVGVEKTVNVPGGFISLRQALAEAHGIAYTGNKSYIQVIRGNIVKPKIYTLNWEHVVHLPNDSLLLMPGDVVYVAARPVTEWNRFISQLLPSFIKTDVINQ